MPTYPTVKACSHIKVTGVRCDSPALRGEQFCYFHQRMIRGVQTPPSARLHPIALLEDEEAIQASLMEVVNALVRNHIDLKRAELILRALNTSVRNARRVRFNAGSQSVTQIPDYPAPPAPPKPAPQRAVDPADLPGYTPLVGTGVVGTSRVETSRVGTGALARPAKASGT